MFSRKNKSKMDEFEAEISELLETGASIRSVWNIIMSRIPEYKKITYHGFRKHVLNKKLQKKESIEDENDFN